MNGCNFVVCQLLGLSVFRYFLPIFMSFGILVICIAHICIICFLDLFEGCLYIFGYSVSDVQLAKFPILWVPFYHFFCCCLGCFFSCVEAFFHFMKSRLSIIGLNSWEIISRKSNHFFIYICKVLPVFSFSVNRFQGKIRSMWSYFCAG